MYRDICPSIVFEEEYREGVMSGIEDSVMGKREANIVGAAEYGYYGLGYKDGLELSGKPKDTSKEYYNQ